jgi:hypothetical protein
MLTATFARITAIFLITVCAASCGGGGRRFARGAGGQHVVSLHAFDEPVTDRLQAQ